MKSNEIFIITSSPISEADIMICETGYNLNSLPTTLRQVQWEVLDESHEGVDTCQESECLQAPPRHPLQHQQPLKWHFLQLWVEENQRNPYIKDCCESDEHDQEGFFAEGGWATYPLLLGHWKLSYRKPVERTDVCVAHGCCRETDSILYEPRVWKVRYEGLKASSVCVLVQMKPSTLGSFF